MRVLHVNKFLHAVGGAEIYVQRLCLKQQADGHVVALFGAEDEAGFAAGVPRLVTPVREYQAEASFVTNALVAGRTLWSREAARDFESAVRTFRPDVVHLHNYAHQLTSSVVSASRRLGLVTVHTAHDYKLACPAFVAVRKGRDCFDCSRSLSPHLLRDGCLHGSRARSAVAFAEGVVARGGRLVAPHVIAPSAYMHSALEQSWLARHTRIHLVRNPVEERSERWLGGGGYFLYAGRLSREKGIDELEQTCTSLGVELLIAGSGPLEGILRQRITAGASTARLLGHLGQDELDAYRVKCIAQVIPSVWPENAPLAALEAATLGVPLVVSDRGGLPEILDLGARGVAVDFGKGDQVARALTGVATLRPGGPAALSPLLRWPSHLDAIESVYRAAADS